MLIGVFPAEVYAHVGALTRPEAADVSAGTDNITVSTGGIMPPTKNLNIYYLENDYIRFAIDSTMCISCQRNYFSC